MASASLSRSISSSPTNPDKFTLSFWVKRSKLGAEQTLFGDYSSANFRGKLGFLGDDRIEYIQKNDGNTTTNVITTRKFRDVFGFYNIVVQFDTSQGTASNRIKIYVNGVQETEFDTASYPAQNLDMRLNQASGTLKIGQDGNSSNYCDLILTHIHLADGQTYAPTVFGSTDATTGIWKPNTAPTVTYGDDGFFLKMDNSANMGLDSSGQGNNFTTSGTIIQTKDTPSNVFATMNPIDSYWMSATYSHTNNRVVTQGSHRTSMAATLGASSGKYYWEVKVVDNTGLIMIGIDTKGASTCSTFSSGQCVEYTGHRTYGWGYDSSNGQVYNNDSSATYGNTYTANDIIGVALDLDNNKLYFAKNGTWQNSGDPTSGSTGTGAVSITAASSTDTGFYFPACSDTSSSNAVTYSTNFGNGYLGGTAVTSAQSPSDGIGIFEYSVPSGYKALCTKSINAQEYS